MLKSLDTLARMAVEEIVARGCLSRSSSRVHASYKILNSIHRSELIDTVSISNIYRIGLIVKV